MHPRDLFPKEKRIISVKTRSIKKEGGTSFERPRDLFPRDLFPKQKRIISVKTRSVKKEGGTSFVRPRDIFPKERRMVSIEARSGRCQHGQGKTYQFCASEGSIQERRKMISVIPTVEP